MAAKTSAYHLICKEAWWELGCSDHGGDAGLDDGECDDAGLYNGHDEAGEDSMNDSGVESHRPNSRMVQLEDGEMRSGRITTQTIKSEVGKANGSVMTDGYVR